MLLAEHAPSKQLPLSQLHRDSTCVLLYWHTRQEAGIACTAFERSDVPESGNCWCILGDEFS